MEVKEQLCLMVGDIIYACYNEEGVDFRVPVIIDAVEKLGHDDCFIDWHPLGSEDSGDVHAEEFDPIPLTAEILEKNGWDIHSEFGANYLAIRKDWHLTIVSKTIGNTPYLRIAHQWICNIPSVHELQHALRLCGMNDLADNFKI